MKDCLDDGCVAVGLEGSDFSRSLPTDLIEITEREHEIEETKIACARKLFDQLNLKYAPENVRYDVVNSFDKLMELVK